MGAPEHDPGARRAVLLEINGRRVNEAIERGARHDRIKFVCECGHLGCNDLIELSKDEYEAVRNGFDRFFLVSGHEIEGVDEVVERHDRYLVVTKVGAGTRMAEETDPRRHA